MLSETVVSLKNQHFFWHGVQIARQKGQDKWTTRDDEQNIDFNFHTMKMYSIQKLLYQSSMPGVLFN